MGWINWREDRQHRREGRDMTLGLAFWILMLIWLVFGVYVGWNAGAPNHYLIGGNLLLFILLLLLGWQTFGAPIH